MKYILSTFLALGITTIMFGQVSKDNNSIRSAKETTTQVANVQGSIIAVKKTGYPCYFEYALIDGQGVQYFVTTSEETGIKLENFVNKKIVLSATYRTFVKPKRNPMEQVAETGNCESNHLDITYIAVK